MDDESEYVQKIEQLDILEGFDLKIIQDKNIFCYGIDAVLLADFAKPSKTGTTWDLCTGNGIVPLIMARKFQGAKFCAIELQPQCSMLAERNVLINGLSDRVSVIQGDIKNIKNLAPGNSCACVTVNPPYFPVTKKSDESTASSIEIARHEIKCTLDDVSKSASWLLNSSGKLFMIHRPERLSEIFVSLTKHGLEPKRMRFVLPEANKAPTMVLIEARKGASPGLIIEAPLVVYQRKGVYSDEVEKIYGRKKTSVD